MYQNPLRFWAIFSQAAGFVAIVVLETWLGRAQAGFWQLWVLVAMLMAALVIAVLRRYQHGRWLKEQERRRQLLQQGLHQDQEET